MSQITDIPGRTGLLAVFLSVMMSSLSALTIDVIPSSPKVGGTVFFNVTGIEEEHRYSEWYRGNGIPAPNQIVRYNSGGTINKGNLYFKEAEIQPNGSLRITNLTKAMAGDYTVNVQGVVNSFQGTVQLNVSEPGMNGGVTTISNSLPPKDMPEIKRLSDGEIAAIVIFSIIGIGALIAAAVYTYIRVKGKNSGPL
ncbi:uncharacterized protein ACMZJ9_018869 isoform 1-T1 [Mantella aurantiaca]